MLLIVAYGASAFCSLPRAHDQALQDAGATLAGFVLFAAAVGTLAWLVNRALRAGQIARAYLRRSEARLKRRNSLLQNTLESIGEGLSVFDGRGRLIARNRRFKLLELPTDLAVGVPLREVLTCQALRGDFGDAEPQAEVERRLAQFYREVPATKERVTASGRTLQIRHSAMPDSGVVSVYPTSPHSRPAKPGCFRPAARPNSPTTRRASSWPI